MLPGFSLSPPGTTPRLRRAGTLVRSPLDGRKDKEKVADGDMTVQKVSLPFRLPVLFFNHYPN